MNFKYYKTDSLIIFIIASTIIFGALSLWLHHKISELPEVSKNLILFTDSITVPFFIVTTFHLINKWLWKTIMFKWLVSIPNLNGRYEGKLVSSQMATGTTNPIVMDCVIEIKQTASSIHISGYFGDIQTNFLSSSSYSVSEEIVRERNDFFRLYYIFTNETGGISQKLNNHSGTAKFIYYPDNKTLDGEYYNLVQNRGTIKVSFNQSKRLGRFIK